METGFAQTIDLTRLEGLDVPEAEMLHRYASMIQMQRQDFNGRVLTIRGDDLRTIACLIGTDLERIPRDVLALECTKSAEQRLPTLECRDDDARGRAPRGSFGHARLCSNPRLSSLRRAGRRPAFSQH